MLKERSLSRPIEHALQVGVLVFALDACAGGQPISRLSPDNESFVPTLTQAVILEPTSTPTQALEATLSPSPTEKPIFTTSAYDFWMPDIHMNQTSVGVLGCGEGILPNSKDIFSSGCSGQNNLFLVGHAYDVFKPLRDAYHSELLKIGQIAYYTDGIGVLHAYEVVSIDHPTITEWGKGSWWADTPTKVMTLNTCDDGEVAGDNAYRIIVRLVPTQVPSDWQEIISIR